ncbi:MAG: hypothetical protein QMD06_00205, partial [Candidatus Altarchaeum sp.]|nr:hypothetical protein [Candidatus Altarchaeum sp.]
MADTDDPIKKSEEDEMIKKAKKIIIESREGKEKKGFFDGIFGRKKDEKDIKDEALKGFGRDEDVVTDVVATEETAPLAEEKDLTPRQIMMEIEKINGKLEVERDMRSNIESHLSDVAEKTGEIRTLVLERDRTFKNIEEEFGKFKVLIEIVQPEQIRKEMNEKEIELLSFKAKLEILNDQFDVQKKNVEKINTTIERIKSFENLSQILKDLDEKISIIENIKRETDRSAGKMEGIFLEMNKRIIEFEKRKNQIDRMDEILRDTVKNLDLFGVKVEKI